MSTSGGGGYCDCGDKEAWKEHPFCANHQPKSKSAEVVLSLVFMWKVSVAYLLSDGDLDLSLTRVSFIKA